MVKVLALSVFHKTSAATTELASAFELSQFGFFQRGTIQVRFLLSFVQAALAPVDPSAIIPLTRRGSSGIHEVFLKNLRPKEHKPNGAGT